jgi:Cys-rich protein (TIGR01571 family)
LLLPQQPFFFDEVAAGQVIKRLQLTLTSEPANTEIGSSRAFAITLYITVLMWVVEICYLVFFPFSSYNSQNPKPEGLQNIVIMYNTLVWMFVVFTAVVVVLLRRAVRGKYKIPGNCWGDFCCMLWCRCCVLGQMLRHTTDYDAYPGQVCSPNGLSSQNGSPMIV